METLIQLWLPILVSAVVVFVASALAWMVLPHHKADVRTYPDETALAEHLGRVNPPPGMYMWPCAGTPDEMKTKEFVARYEAGPWGSMTVLGAKPNFARNLVTVFLFYVLVGIFVGYITSLARAAGAPFLDVFRVAGAVGVLAYCAGSIPNAVFFGKPGRFVLTDLIDGAIYGLLTGLVFGWLWP